MSKYEQLIEFIINEQEDKARELFHQIVVEKSREIYESIIDEQDLAEIGGDPVESMVDEVTADQIGMAEEEEDDMDMPGDDEVDMDMDMDVEEPAGEVTAMDLATAKDDIDAIFADLMAQAGGQQTDMDSEMDLDSEEEFDADDEEEFDADDEEDMMEASEKDDEEEEEEEDDDEEDLQESKAAKKEDMLKAKEKDAKGKRKMTEAEWLREYVDQIGDVYSQEPAQEEGYEVGAGKKAKVDKASTAVGPGVDMGGKVVKAKGSEQNPDGKQTPEPNNEYTKGKGNLPHAGKFKNVPGGNAGKTTFKTKEGEYSKSHGAEGQTTGGKVPVTAKSPLAKA